MMTEPIFPRWHTELADLERRYFTRLVEVCNGSHARIARASGLSGTSVRNVLERHDLFARCRELRRTTTPSKHSPECLMWDRGPCDCHRSQARAAE